MPLYEYSCNKCGKQFEKLVSMSNRDKPQKCPSCDSEDTQKLMSTFATKSDGSGPTSSGGGGGGFS